MKGLVFTYVATFGGSVVALWRPYYGFLIYVAFATLKPESLWHWSVPEGNYSRIIAGAFLLGWLLQGLGSWRWGRAAPAVCLLLIFWAWAFLGACISPAQDAAWKSIIALSKIYLPFLAGLSLIDSVDKLKQLAWVIIAAHGYLAFEVHLKYYAGNFNPIDWSFGGLDNNSFAITMVAASGVALFFGLTAPTLWQKGLALLAGGLMGHMVLFSMSRGGMLAMCITGLMAIWLIPKRPVHLLGLALGALAMLQLAGPQVREEFMTTFAKRELRDFSAQSRFDLARDALDCMLHKPILGCGFENWGNVAPNYGWPRGKEVHNTWLQTGAELGFPGLVSLLGFYLLMCWRLLAVARDRNSEIASTDLPSLSRMVIASLAGFLVAATAVTCEGVEVPYYVAAMGAGVLRLHAAYAGDTCSLQAEDSGVVVSPRLATME